MNKEPFFTETIVYIARGDEHVLRNLSDEEFITVAEEDGDAYSLDEFQAAYNSDQLYSRDSIMRIITKRATGEIHYTDQFKAIDW